MMILNRVPVSPMSQLFNTLFNDTTPQAQRSSWVHSAPPMNVWEQPDRFCIEAELPGYRMEDIDVTVHENELTIRGQRQQQQTVEGATYLRRERSTGSFTRTWTLSSEIDAQRIEATLKDGVLLVQAPKAAKAMPRKIKVTSPSA